jgi:hypothetical protein
MRARGTIAMGVWLLTAGFSADRSGEMHNVLDAVLELLPAASFPRSVVLSGTRRLRLR